MQSLDVAAEYRPHADGGDEAVKVHDHAGLITVGIGDHHAGTIRVMLEDRSDGAVQFCIHEDHVLAVFNGFQGHPGAEFHRAGHLDHRVHTLGSAKRQGIRGNGMGALADGLFQGLRIVRLNHLLHTGFPKGA